MLGHLHASSPVNPSASLTEFSTGMGDPATNSVINRELFDEIRLMVEAAPWFHSDVGLK